MRRDFSRIRKVITTISFYQLVQTVNKRYNAYVVLLGNKLQDGENGGIKNDTNYIDLHIYRDRFTIPTNIGGDPAFGTISLLLM